MARVQADHVMGYLVKPAKQADIEAAVTLAVSHFERLQTLRNEVAALGHALEERKLVERAKGAVMRRVGADEEQAYCRLRKLASDRNQKLVELAGVILAAEEGSPCLIHQPGDAVRFGSVVCLFSRFLKAEKRTEPPGLCIRGSRNDLQPDKNRTTGQWA